VTFLTGQGYFQALEGLGDEFLRIRSDDVLAKIKRREADWEQWVEPEVAEAIKSQGLFGYGRGGTG